MKKLRISLAAGAILLAVGGTFASSALTTYYEYKVISGTPTCQPHVVSQECSPEFTQPCSAAVQLRENSNISNMCGNILFRP